MSRKLFFYLGRQRRSELHGSGSILYIGTDMMPLAALSSVNFQHEVLCLVVDRSRSILGAVQTPGSKAAYSVYGDDSQHQAAYSQAFNGEHVDENLCGYHLGCGYRFYHPVLMRFFSVDAESPFGQGGINGYAYCAGDPVNRVDPSGRGFSFLDLAHWVNSKAQKNIFPVGERAPFSNLGIASGFDGYSVKHRFKRGSVELVTERMSPGNFHALIARYPDQAEAIMIDLTKRALRRIQGQETSPRAFVEKRFRRGLTMLDGDMAMVISDVGTPSSKFSDVRRRLEVGGNQFEEEVVKILYQRLESLRTGKPLIEKDWHADYWNDRFAP